MDPSGIVFSILISIFPLFLTIANMKNLFSNIKFAPRAIDIMIFIFGPIYMVFIYGFWSPMPWYQSTSYGWYGLPFHEPVTHYLTLIVLPVIGFMGYAILRIRKKPLPPLITVLCMSAMYI